MADGLGARLVRAIAAQDEKALGECFAPEVEFRALVPSGLRERTGAGETAALIAQWFGDSSELRLLESHDQDVADRLHISYRFEGVDGGEPYVVEQQLYCVVSEGRVVRADLLCSGFRPRPGA